MDPSYPVWSFRALADGFAEGEMAVGLRPGDVRAPDLVLSPEVAVEGRVVDAQGHPLQGVTVFRPPGERSRAMTDDDGRFRLGRLGPDRTALLCTRFEGYAPAWIPWRARDANGPLEIVLERGGTLEGRVTEWNGTPVRGADVSSGAGPLAWGQPRTRTDAQGRFRLEGVPPGSPRIWASRPGYAAADVSVRLEPGGRLADVDLTLARGGSVAGVVLDADGAPLPGAQIVPGPLPDSSGFVGSMTRSDEAGRFRLDGLREPRFVLTVFAPGCTKLERTVATGETDLVLQPARAGGLAGRVVDARTGEPVESFTVRFEMLPPEERGEVPFLITGTAWYDHGVAFTGTDGVWTSGSDALEIGAVTAIVIEAPGYAEARVERAVVTGEPDPEELRIELFSGTEVTGAVLDGRTGAPLVGARVRRVVPAGGDGEAQRYRPDPERSAESDERGEFVLRNVPAGEMSLVVETSSELGQ